MFIHYYSTINIALCTNWRFFHFYFKNNNKENRWRKIVWTEYHHSQQTPATEQISSNILISFRCETYLCISFEYIKSKIIDRKYSSFWFVKWNKRMKEYFIFKKSVIRWMLHNVFVNGFANIENPIHLLHLLELAINCFFCVCCFIKLTIGTWNLINVTNRIAFGSA